MKNFKRFITLALALVMVLSMSSVAFASEDETPSTSGPELPTATATVIQQEGYTYAMNFKAVEPTAEQLAYYGDWSADFVLTITGMKEGQSVIFNGNNSADGYLGGQYDAWSPNWVRVPFENVTLTNGEDLMIMEYATANVADYTGTTYKDIVETVKDFNCGVYFAPSILGENPDMKVTLKLVITKGEETHVIGEPHTFEAKIPTLPTATVKEISATVNGEPLTFAMNFLANSITEEQLAWYGDYSADFVMTVNKEVTFDGVNEGSNFLAGQYDWHSDKWFKLPTSFTVNAGDEIKILEHMGTLMGSMDKVSVQYVYEKVQDFNCGVYFSKAFLDAPANDGLVVALQLRVYPGEDKTVYNVIGDTYTFTVSSAKDEEGNVGSITDLLDKAENAAEGGTVTLTSSATTAKVDVAEKVTLDLSGNTLEAMRVVSSGAITDSTNGQALLKVEKLNFLPDSNQKQLPVYDTVAQGYRFFDVEKIRYALLSENKYAFQPLFDEATKDLLLAGADRTGVTMLVTVTWDNNGVEGKAEFTYTDAMVKEYLESYNNGSYANMFTLTINNADNLSGLSFKAVVRSSTGMEMAAPQVAADA